MIIDWWQFLLNCFLIVAVIQILYYLLIFSRLAFYNSKNNDPEKQAVSVIICARDEAANLTEYLPAVLNQKYDLPHEVIAVNDNSLDESKYILKNFKESFPQ